MQSGEGGRLGLFHLEGDVGVWASNHRVLLMLTLAGLCGAGLRGVAGLRSLSTTADQGQSEDLVVAFGTAPLLRIIIRDVHHGQTGR